jgi:hypothetical protein
VEASAAMSTNRRKQQARQRGARRQAERQVRRERAAELFDQGRSQAKVARELDVSRQASAAGMPAGKPQEPRDSRAEGRPVAAPRLATISWRQSSRRCWKAHRSKWPICCGDRPSTTAWPGLSRAGGMLQLPALLRQSRRGGLVGEVVPLPGGTVTLQAAVDAFLEHRDLAPSTGGSIGPRSPAWWPSSAQQCGARTADRHRASQALAAVCPPGSGQGAGAA